MGLECYKFSDGSCFGTGVCVVAGYLGFGLVV